MRVGVREGKIGRERKIR